MLSRSGRAKGYQPRGMVSGNGFLKDARRMLRRAGRFLVKNGKVITRDVASSLGPQILTLLASKAGEEASKAGVPDFIVNQSAKLAQQGAQKLGDVIKPQEELSKNQKLVSSFVNSQSSDILNEILKRSGNGVIPPRGNGVGNGVIPPRGNGVIPPRGNGVIPPRGNGVGNGSRLLGNGSRLLGNGSRLLGNGSDVFASEAPRIAQK